MKYLLRAALIVLLSLVSLGYAQDHQEQFEGKQEDPDMEALRKWIRNKRMVTIKEIGGDLSISGEVRAEMQGANEKKNGIRQRGQSGATNRPSYAYDVEVNILLDYRNDRTWGSIKLEFDNDAGVVSGSVNHLALERAFIGGRVYDGDTFVFDIEVGRRNLGNLFDSKLEYSALYDGISFKFNKATESIGDFYLNLGTFLVNDRTNHYAYVGEMGFLRIGNTGLYTKYSLIDWTKDYNKPRKELSFDFVISNVVLGYQCNLPVINKFLKLYTGGLLNHKAQEIDLTNYKKANWGAYVGFSLGQIRKKGDWAFDTSYQLLAAQAVPDFDSAGIKRGNAAGVGFYTTGTYGDGDPTTRETAVGGGNFKGWEAEFLYAITGNLTMLNNFKISNTLDKAIGPNLKFYQYELEFIYAF